MLVRKCCIAALVQNGSLNSISPNKKKQSVAKCNGCWTCLFWYRFLFVFVCVKSFQIFCDVCVSMFYWFLYLFKLIKKSPFGENVTTLRVTPAKKKKKNTVWFDNFNVSLGKPQNYYAFHVLLFNIFVSKNCIFRVVHDTKSLTNTCDTSVVLNNS